MWVKSSFLGLLSALDAVLLLWCVCAVSPLKGSNWMALRKFILEERSYSSVWATVNSTRWDSFTWLINHACSDHVYKCEFCFKLTQAPSEQCVKF